MEPPVCQPEPSSFHGRPFPLVKYAHLLSHVWSFPGLVNTDCLSLPCVIAAWPVICPLYRFHYAKRIDNQQHIQAHIDYWGTEEAMAEGSPQTIIEKDAQVELPPVLFLMKANDKNHPLEMQERFIASYGKRGGPIEVHTFDGLPEHRMVPSSSQPETMRFIDIVSAFIGRQTR